MVQNKTFKVKFKIQGGLQAHQDYEEMLSSPCFAEAVDKAHVMAATLLRQDSTGERYATFQIFGASGSEPLTKSVFQVGAPKKVEEANILLGLGY
ncbi:MAG: hypothetical protein NT053_02465 [Cyanobacteria bacterium]|nr:hypothetical protein [Cyanobacteriota bacterium]